MHECFTGLTLHKNYDRRKFYNVHMPDWSLRVVQVDVRSFDLLPDQNVGIARMVESGGAKTDYWAKLD